ncbi:MAG: DUF3800 domain-containing protein [Pacificibacter sp.]|uniref:DUF3800 domain-containing protein n=1 Tax=Pacificibacter sp. TaxID=1917866 RepID=UPI00321ABDB4
MAKRHYIIYCDESSKKGAHFSNFYGGALIKAQDREAIEEALNSKKEELNLTGEIKWTKVTANYLEKYEEFMDFYFSFIESGRIKIRIMFTHNMYRPVLNAEQQDLGYFLLYYQLVKHSFGIKYSNPNRIDRVYFSLLLDDLPDTKAKCDNFKTMLSEIPQTNGFRDMGIHIPKQQIAEVDSSKHVVLQGLDVILGSMHFRLNDLHKIKPVGAQRRGKRTIAKEKLYKRMNAQIRAIYPNFNIGNSTGQAKGPSDKWSHPYRHWRFKPKQHTIDETVVKGKAP